MRAIRFKAFGDPSVLELTEVADPAVGETTALVRVMAASINPSDAEKLILGAEDLPAEVLEALTPGFVAGDYHAAPITETCGLGEARSPIVPGAPGAPGAPGVPGAPGAPGRSPHYN